MHADARGRTQTNAGKITSSVGADATPRRVRTQDICSRTFGMYYSSLASLACYLLPDHAHFSVCYMSCPALAALHNAEVGGAVTFICVSTARRMTVLSLLQAYCFCFLTSFATSAWVWHSPLLWRTNSLVPQALVSSCCSLTVSASAAVPRLLWFQLAAPRLCLLQLLLPDSVLFSWCSSSAFASYHARTVQSIISTKVARLMYWYRDTILLSQ